MKKFVVRRFFRLYPIYWLSIAFALLATFILSKGVFDHNAILANLTMLQKFFGEPHIQGLYWTLQAELIFYALCATLFSFGMLNNPIHHLNASLIVLTVFIVFSIAAKKIPALQGIPKELMYIPYVLAIMFCGTILRTLLTISLSKKQKLVLLSGLVATFGVPVIVVLLHSAGINIVDHPMRFAFGHLLGLTLFVGGFYSLKTSPPVLLWFGTISYSIYLFHPIANKSIHWIRVQEWATNIASLHMGFYMLVVVAMTLIISSVTYLLVEKPSIDLSYKLTQKHRH